MRKHISILALVVVLLMSLLSCDIKTDRPFAGDLMIEVTGLPENVKYVALFCNLNDWKPENVNETDFIQPVFVTNEGVRKVQFWSEDRKNVVPGVDLKAVPGLKGYLFSSQLECQFVPMEDVVKLDGLWWARAISGSSNYGNVKNNLVYNFSSRGASNPMSLGLNVSSNAADIMVQRVHYENYDQALVPSFE